MQHTTVLSYSTSSLATTSGVYIYQRYIPLWIYSGPVRWDSRLSQNWNLPSRRPCSLQWSVHSGDKRIYFSMYITHKTTDRLLFFLHGPGEGLQCNLTILRQSGWEDLLNSTLIINEKRFFVYEDAASTLRPNMILFFNSVTAHTADM